MLFIVVLQNFVVLHTRSAKQALFNYDDGDPNFSVNFADDNCGDDLYFPIGAEVVIDERDPSSFTVKDRDGDAIQFNAYTPVKLFEPQGERDINLNDIRLEVTEPNRLWVKVGKFDVLLNHTDEGIVVDIWPWVAADAPVLPDEPLGTTYAFDADADAALEIDPE